MGASQLGKEKGHKNGMLVKKVQSNVILAIKLNLHWYSPILEINNNMYIIILIYISIYFLMKAAPL